MNDDSAALLAVALSHLRRFAFFTRDNPYASMRASEELSPEASTTLLAIMDGRLEVDEWLESDAGTVALGTVGVGCLPRDLQLTSDRSVAVTSVHAFVDAPLFWWVVSVLWCLTVGRRVDSLLDRNIKGYRLHRAFLDDPATSGFMFRNPSSSYAAWRREVARASNRNPGSLIAASTIDLESFYYSITAAPDEIQQVILGGGDDGSVNALSSTERALSELLSAAHAAFAARCVPVKPRSLDDFTHLLPLPVGFPSSRILANVVISTVLGELRSKEHLIEAVAYADDVVVLSGELPGPRESVEDYLTRLGVIDEAQKHLDCPAARRMSLLRVNLEKSGVSYGRGVRKPPEMETDELSDNDDDLDQPTVFPDQRFAPQLDPYIDAQPSPEWGGPLRTVLRTPHHRQRFPHALEARLTTLVGDIAVGLTREAIGDRLTALLEGLDASAFLQLRRFWSDLVVSGLAADGWRGAVTLTEDFESAVDAIEPLDGVPEAQSAALLDGLTLSWTHAVAQACAAALSAADRAAFAQAHPSLMPAHQIETQTVVREADELRNRSLVPVHFVAVPLAEFTDWSGRLLGDGAFADFVSWARSRPRGLFEPTRRRLSEATRFIQLHEACLAVHLWLRPNEIKWLDRAFQLLRSQPLVRVDDLSALRTVARHAINPPRQGRPIPPALKLRMALPSVLIDSGQLEVLLSQEKRRLGAIVASSRERTRATVLAAAKRKADVLVLPEWAVLPEQLSWLMDQARYAEMLTIAGQAPDIVSGTYSNRLWSGIPLRDSAGRRACVVPPPREKNYLSPHERKPLSERGIAVSKTAPIPIYTWRGLGVGSLICFEFADVSTRHSLRASADLLTVSSLNRDWRYFDAIQESTTRDNYCVTFCVNTSEFPGTRIMRPTKNEKAVVASVHGSEWPAVVMRNMDLRPVIAARISGKHPGEVLDEAPLDGLELVDYKPLPPVW